MPADEYSVGGGGKLKLKGSKVSDGRIEKKKKKAKKSNPESGSKKESEDAPSASTSQAVDDKESPPTSSLPPQDEESDAGVSAGASGKTEAERKYEEMRKKRLQERLKREGVKTHKERVEELNKYLSRLSEHHDMPKIGPG
ncbi:hypothetical protein ANOM_002384 [Aspergillus nomiae NRRL 13137]|uniref:DUF1754-domain-containing protein n=1 Tax=Aspergillus nomiae NRRL (strain ATCC 15546 / NRRL 13137 / CBS 260.88 / M93) TaxID=1509407 RepID=A0A0L1JDY5_ASPN3|nr:uncharacterized protein ANOM_002384 [Aspergillus nomiae NRRL 13137]KNG89638.1 hypothetical protein ANOM_002384 [Aspergillus nomiae NRRL 13137]